MMSPTALLDVSTRKYPGYVSLVDADLIEVLCRYKWGVHVSGPVKSLYVRTRVGGRKNSIYIKLHRFVIDAPKGIEVDHINGDILDNRRSNLRLASRNEQMWNLPRPRHNTSGYKGVSRFRKVWRATIQQKGKWMHLGLFKTPLEAAHAYDAAARDLFGEFARPNFPYLLCDTRPGTVLRAVG